MSTERAVRILAGSMVLASLALATWVSRYWLFLTLFVGLNLLQSGITRWCLAESIFRSIGLKSGGLDTSCSRG